jgi:hypothetical protein
VRYALGAPLRPLVVTNIYNDPVEYSLRESVSAKRREGRGLDSDLGRNLIKRAIFYVMTRKSR